MSGKVRIVGELFFKVVLGYCLGCLSFAVGELPALGQGQEGKRVDQKTDCGQGLVVRLEDWRAPDAVKLRDRGGFDVWASPPLFTICPKDVREAEVSMLVVRCGTPEDCEVFRRRAVAARSFDVTLKLTYLASWKVVRELRSRAVDRWLGWVPVVVQSNGLIATGYIVWGGGCALPEAWIGVAFGDDLEEAERFAHGFTSKVKWPGGRPTLAPSPGP
ncbi:MAG: hypothetical protein KatS3mg077_2017 [Candidatus Binatia bacterium]|nr:MAG: hypothetical protein KatS3mg077_2017 [Candidatus Binatia bacterium]